MMSFVKHISFYLSCLIILQQPCIVIPAESIPQKLARADDSRGVVLIPGDGGSALEIRIDSKPNGVRHWWCKTTTHNQWERLWLRPSQLLPKQIDCWSDNIKLHYNATLDKVSDPPGTEIRVVPGKVGLELIRGNAKSNVYHELMEALENNSPQQAWNTTTASHVEAAPYDFRFSPKGRPSFLEELQKLVEKTFEKTQSKVTLITHSLGSLFGHYFLTQFVSKEWKKKHIASWIPVSPAFGGAVVLVKLLTSGDVEGIKWLSGLDVRDEQRSYETNLWLLPNPMLWSQAEVLVSTPTRNYTAHDYEDLFRGLNYTNGIALWCRVRNLTLWDPQTKALADPQVPVYPIYGNNVPTAVQYQFFGGNDFDKGPSSTSMSLQGDGTIPLRSLEAGNAWIQAHPPLVVNGGTHTGILSHNDVISHVLEIVRTPETTRASTTTLDLY